MASALTITIENSINRKTFLLIIGDSDAKVQTDQSTDAVGWFWTSATGYENERTIIVGFLQYLFFIICQPFALFISFNTSPLQPSYSLDSSPDSCD